MDIQLLGYGVAFWGVGFGIGYAFRAFDLIGRDLTS